MVTKYPPGLFSQKLAVEDGEISQIGISIIQLRDIYLNRVRHNKKLKGGIAVWDLGPISIWRPSFPGSGIPM